MGGEGEERKDEGERGGGGGREGEGRRRETRDFRGLRVFSHPGSTKRYQKVRFFGYFLSRFKGDFPSRFNIIPSRE